jgi:hypothetical protein
MTRKELQRYAAEASSRFVKKYKADNHKKQGASMPSGVYDDLRRSIEKQILLVAKSGNAPRTLAPPATLTIKGK